METRMVIARLCKAFNSFVLNSGTIWLDVALQSRLKSMCLLYCDVPVLSWSQCYVVFVILCSFFPLQCFVVNTGSPATVCFQKKKKKRRNKIVFYWIKRCLLEPFLPFRVFSGPLVMTAFLQPRCGLVWFGLVPFSMFVFDFPFHLYGKFCYALLLFIF